MPCGTLDFLGNLHILLRPVALADSGVFVLTRVFFSVCILTITALLNVYVAV